jgi:SET domain-containing protein
MALFEKYLQIKKSKLPQAGKGLFTKIDIPKGIRVVEYKGKLRRWKEVKHLDGYNGYLMYISRDAVIDAQPAINTFCRYANDANGFGKIPGLKNNCEYVSEGTKCYIESLRPIKKGEEILVSYGKDFWKLQRKIRAS